jgi:hypothetical protein
MSRVEDLARRRRLLIRRCAAERDAIGALGLRVAGPLTWVDRGLSLAPWLLGAGSVALFAARPRRLLRWGGHAFQLAMMLLRLRKGARG